MDRKTQDERRLAIAALERHTAWGLHPQTLALLAAVARGEVSVAEVAAEQAPEAAGPQALRGAQATGGVALLRLQGLITPRASFLSMLFGGGGGLQTFRSQLREAVSSDDISAIVLDIDSPGGSTDLVAETAAELRAARTTKPIVAVANTWAASAAYWLAAQADELVVTASGEVGSIGVYTMHEDWSKFDEEFGVKTTLISAGKYKTEGNRFEPLAEEAEAAMQAKVDEYYGLFVADVAKGRGVAASAVRSGYGEGRMLTAKQAVAAGMADRVDTLEATVAKLVRNPSRARRRADADETVQRLAAGESIDDADASDVRAAQALIHFTEGNPDPNPVPVAGEEETVRPSEPYIDVMFGAQR